MGIKSVILCCATLLAFCVGCAGGGSGSPIAPDLTGLELTRPAEAIPGTESNHFLWGFWSVLYDIETQEFEVIPIRGATMHLNIARLIGQAPIGLAVKVNSLNIPDRLLDFDITITHPVPDSDLRGFDVRGILMGPGETVAAQSDPSLVYCSLNGTRLLNADGYTRWWNAVEFTDPGLFGYENNFVLPGFLVPTTTLNPYKYFSDPLGPNDPVVPGVNETNRGTFSTDGEPPSVTRNYLVRFPVIGGNQKLGFHYAIDASYAPPTGGSATPKPVGDFPPAANCPEPFHVEVKCDQSSVYYESDSSRGGHLVLDIEVYDWQAASNPDGVNGEIDAIIVESPTLFNGMKLVEMNSMMGTQSTSSIFHITIPNVTPTDVEGQEVLVTVRSSNPTSYAPPNGNADYPEQAALAAYAMVDVPVAPIKPSGFNESITVLSPNGFEEWTYNNPASIIWNWTGDPEDIAIDLSLDGGSNFDIPIASDVDNIGQYDLTVGDWTSDEAKLRFTTSTDEYYSHDFVINPSITVLSPNGGEYWIEGNMFEVTWNASSSIKDLKLLLSGSSGGDATIPVDLSTPNDGSFMWYITPSMFAGEHCRIMIVDALPTMIADESDNEFVIFSEQYAPVKVTSPNGNEIWKAQTTHEITWEAEADISSVRIDLSLDNGLTWPVLIAGSAPNTGSFSWNPIPDEAVGENNRVRITSVNNSSEYDISNAKFSIKPMGDSYIEIGVPVDSDTWQIGCSQELEWVWDGTINSVNILFKLDSEPTYTPLTSGAANAGWEIVEFEPDGIEDIALWESTDLTGTVKVEDSGNPAVFDVVPVTIPINLGILYDMVQASEEGDADNDNIPDDVEIFLGTDPTDRDCDIPNPDSFFDNVEIFGNGYFDPYDLIPDEDQDGVIAPLDMDDNSDGVNDGESVDTDLDGIPNYLEYYGYTFDWMSGTYEVWDGESVDEPYFKTDPLQPSTDQDPYSDSMEVSGAFMDVSVREPGDYPMVPAYPDILIRLEGYDVILNQEITFEQGESLEHGTEWSAETSREHGSEIEHSWGVGIEAGFEIGKDPKVTGKIAVNYGGHYAETNSVGYTVSQGGSLVDSSSWSKATSASTTDAARVRLYLKAYNYGTSCASNIVPTLTLKIGNRNVTTFKPQGTMINILEPGGIYPAAANTYWVIDTTEAGPISLSLDDLRAIECGAPISIVITQMNAEVMLMNNSGQWESAGEWGEYMARCEAVCSNIYLELDGGRFLHYLVYSDDSYLAPEVTFGDAMIWIAGAGSDASDTWITYYDQFGIEQHQSLVGWEFAFDPQTLLANGLGVSPISLPDPDYNIADLVLNPDSTIVGKMPREDLDDELIGAQIAFAYLDEELDIVRALVYDYNGVDTVTYKDRYDNYIEIEEFIEGSGIYEYTIPSDYVHFGTELIIASGINPPADPQYAETVRFVKKVVYPEIITTIPPEIRNIELDIVNRYLYCQIVSDPGFPVTSAKAYHPMFTDAKDLVKTPLWMGDPYGYYLENFTGITVDNYDDIILEAVVTGGGYDVYKLNDSNLLNNDFKGHGLLYAYHERLEFFSSWWCGNTYEVEQINLDVENFEPVKQKFIKDDFWNGGARRWLQEYQDQMQVNSWDVLVRYYDPVDDSQKWGTTNSWLFWSNREYAIYSGTNPFRDITSSECESQIFNPPGGGIPLSEWESGTAITTMPLIVIIKTDAGRYSKLLISQVNVVDLADYNYNGIFPIYQQSSVYVDYDYVTFKTDQESSVWSEGTTTLQAEVNYEPIAPGSTVMVEGLQYSTFDIDTASKQVINKDEFWTQAMTPASNIDIWFRYYSGDGTWPSPGPDVEPLGPTPGWILFSHNNFDVEYDDVDMSELTRLDVTARSFPYENYYFMPDGVYSASDQDWMVYLQSDEGRWAAINVQALTSGLVYDTESCLHTGQLGIKYKIFKKPGD